MYNDFTVPVQHSIDADSCRNASLDDMFVELRLQESGYTHLPETLDYRDVVEMQKKMQSNKPIQMSQLFDKCADERAITNPKKVLILGKAGIGKTTLIKQMAKQWAEKALWKDDVDYLFVITLRQLRPGEKLTLGDLLLGGLPLTEDEKTTALLTLRENSQRVILVLEGMDEATYFESVTELERDYNKKIDLNTLLSSIIGDTMLPGAKVILTSRPNNNVPSNACHRTVELYGFSQESIEQYIHKFCGEDTKLEHFITDYLQRNVNIATMCYVAVQCNFVCVCLANMYSSSHSDHTPSVNTMTQLYVLAVTNLAKKLHPSLKSINSPIDQKKFFDTVGKSLKNHAELAKHCTMSTPLRIIIYEDDLDTFGVCGADKHTGFLAESVTRDLDAIGWTRKCWTFSHLTIQEMFAAIGLLRGPSEAILELISNVYVRRQHGVLITFITGLLCDPQNACFMRGLQSDVDQLDPRTFMKKLADNIDVLQLTIAIYEAQRPEFVELLPKAIAPQSVFPTEMMSLAWVLKQHECRVITLKLVMKTFHSHSFNILRLHCKICKNFSGGIMVVNV